MGEKINRQTITGCSSGISTISVILALCAYFVYGQSVPVALIVLLMSLVFSALVFVGLIPFFGGIFYWLLAAKWLKPVFMEWAGIHETWVTTLVYWIPFVGALIICLITSIFALILLAKLLFK